MSALIEIQGLTKTYIMGADTVQALRGVDLSIFKNEYTALMGPSGSGKSTLMNLLGCLDTPTSGTYMLNGNDVSSMNDSELAEIRNKEIGFVFQTFNLLPRLSALDNVALPLIYAGMSKSARIERASHVLEITGLGDRMTHKPNELSGGQRQRVAIARALVNNPSIILADEPTGNLDSKTSDEIMRIFEEIHSQGNTIILVTHEPDVSLHAHRIVRLKDGAIESDTINENPVKYGIPVGVH
ncbi:MAG: ABC transporter ATP-binding protein [Saprospiraceae bacterium]|jgi:putative ABC transport system ATP-binding protein|nr:ABC transporter ATP-binding protein [Saprospiraceae bacterium]MBK6481429.1 ABC transporter ATP-binding protein [Saprospiraceae bacterium]MBK6815901.1 ABC transporter ATP-binding protein [Saprospiraceae bacterium]MBK7370627.1 ABC transporter ATP-binding protein [Saprospiraceae bacterium]MBK7438786.1 ABC transporter ATP-binding protein [Saprospiraceae bacterium]